MMLAFLETVDVLTNNLILSGFGIGYRGSGFQPYLNFLHDSILLRFNTHVYKKSSEKASRCRSSSPTQLNYLLLSLLGTSITL